MNRKDLAELKREIVFLSSGKAKGFADSVRLKLSDRINGDIRLRDEYECLAWDDRRFIKKNASTFDSLLDYTKYLGATCGYVVCVLYPDDLLYKNADKNNSSYYVPRDNVIFELGLFFGTLGRANTYFLFCDKARNKTVHIPTDLDGITGFKYAWDGNTNSPNKDAASHLAVSLYDEIVSNWIPKPLDRSKESIEVTVSKTTSLIRDITTNETELSSEKVEIDASGTKLSAQAEYSLGEKVMSTPKRTSNFPKPLTHGIPPRT